MKGDDLRGSEGGIAAKNEGVVNREDISGGKTEGSGTKVGKAE